MKKETSSKNNPKPDPCPVAFCMEAIGGKWKPIIIFRISKGINLFTVLMKHVEGINKQMLSKQLKEMEKSGILERKIFPEIPPRVEYSLTSKGKSLLPVIQAMNKWGLKHMPGVKTAKKDDTQQLPLFD